MSLKSQPRKAHSSWVPARVKPNIISPVSKNLHKVESPTQRVAAWGRSSSSKLRLDIQCVSQKSAAHNNITIIIIMNTIFTCNRASHQIYFNPIKLNHLFAICREQIIDPVNSIFVYVQIGLCTVLHSEVGILHYSVKMFYCCITSCSLLRNYGNTFVLFKTAKCSGPEAAKKPQTIPPLYISFLFMPHTVITVPSKEKANANCGGLIIEQRECRGIMYFWSTWQIFVCIHSSKWGSRK